MGYPFLRVNARTLTHLKWLWALPIVLGLCGAGCKNNGRSGGSKKSKDRPAHDPSTDTADPANPRIDCTVLERTLRRCGLMVAAAGDPKLPTRLASIPKSLRPSVLRGIRDGLVFRIVEPCRHHRGSMPQTRTVASCLEQYRKAIRKSAPPPSRKAKAGTPAGPDPCTVFAACMRKLFPAPTATARGKTSPSTPAKPRPR
jgi:hypothetical protein